MTTVAIAIRAPSSTPERNQLLTGVSSASARGTAVATHEVKLTGLRSTAALGSISTLLGSDRSVTPLGLSATGHTGTPKADRSVALTGRTITSSLGTIVWGTGPAADLFPRTAAMCIGSPYTAYGTSNFRVWAGKHHLVVYNGYIGVEQNEGFTFAATMQAQRNNGVSNGIISRPVMYCMQQQLGINPGSGNSNTFTWLCKDVRQPSPAQPSVSWWTRTSYPSGSIVTADTANDGAVNYCRGNPPGGHGGNINDDAAWYYWNVHTQGNAVSAFGESANIATNPYLMGIFWDNQWWAPRYDGSWSWGSSLSHTAYSTVCPLLQQGNADLVAATRNYFANAVVVGNCNYANDTVNNGAPAIGQLYGQAGIYDFVYSENSMGPNSTEHNAGGFGTSTTRAMGAFIRGEAQCTATGSLVFQLCGRPTGVHWTNDSSQSSWVAADWQAVRYGEAWCMLRGWHICMTSADVGGAGQSPALQWWSDTYDKGGTGLSWLGAATDPPQTSAQFAGGVWGRYFQHGLVLCNPKGNGSKTVTIPANTYRTLPANGFSDPAVNTNTTITGTTVTLADGDGRILYKF